MGTIKKRERTCQDTEISRQSARHTYECKDKDRRRQAATLRQREHAHSAAQCDMCVYAGNRVDVL